MLWKYLHLIENTGCPYGTSGVPYLVTFDLKTWQEILLYVHKVQQKQSYMPKSIPKEATYIAPEVYIWWIKK